MRATRNLILRYSYEHTLLTNLYDSGVTWCCFRGSACAQLSTLAAQYVSDDTRDKPLDAHHGVYRP